MSRTFSSSLVGFGAVILCLSAVAGGCSSTSSSGTGGTDSGAPGEAGSDAPPAVMCTQPAGCGQPAPASTQLSTPTVSLKTDIVPLFQMSCALSTSCHQLQESGPSLLYLGGSVSQPADPAGILKAVVNVKAVELPSMNYVTPGMPEESYLMHKMDGDQCQFASMCTTNPIPMCGVVMPQSGCALEAPDGGVDPRDTVRRWIFQGALNN